MSVTVPGLNETRLPKIIQAIQQLASGRSNAFGTVTLAVSPATSTTVVDRNCGTDTVPSLTPTTANAAAAQATTFIPTASIINGAFVIQHASSAATDRKFLYALHG
jgi:hypothetical protein